MIPLIKIYFECYRNFLHYLKFVLVLVTCCSKKTTVERFTMDVIEM